MVAVPAPVPVAIPETGSTVATPVLLLLHVPPPMALLNAEAAPTQKLVVPVMGAVGLTVTVDVAVSLNPQASVTTIE